MVANLAQHNAELGHIRLLVRLVQIVPQRLSERAFPLVHSVEQTLQHLLTELQIERYTTTKVAALRLDSTLDVLY